MACKVTPRQVNEEIREELETALPGLSVKFTPYGEYTYNTYDYVRGLSNEELLSLLEKGGNSLAIARELARVGDTFQGLDIDNSDEWAIQNFSEGLDNGWADEVGDFIQAVKSRDLSTISNILKDYIAFFLDTNFRKLLFDRYGRDITSSNVNSMDDLMLIREDESIPIDTYFEATQREADMHTEQNEADEMLQIQQDNISEEELRAKYFDGRSSQKSYREQYIQPRTAKERISIYKILSKRGALKNAGDVVSAIIQGNSPKKDVAIGVLRALNEQEIPIKFVSKDSIPKTTNSQGEYTPDFYYDGETIYVNMDSTKQPETVILQAVLYANTMRSISNGQAQDTVAIAEKIMEAFPHLGFTSPENVITNLFIDKEVAYALRSKQSGTTGRNGIKNILELTFETLLADNGYSTSDSYLNQTLSLVYETIPVANLNPKERGYSAPQLSLELEVANSARNLSGAGDFENSNENARKFGKPKPHTDDIPEPSEWIPKGLTDSFQKGLISSKTYEQTIRNINRLRNAHRKIRLTEFVLPNGETRTTYYSAETGKSYDRVSNKVNDEVVEGNLYLGAASKHGNKVDEFLRALVDGGLTDEMKKRDYFGDESVYDKIHNSMLALINEFEELGEEIIPGEIILHDDTYGIAGTVDVMTVDEKGVFRIYDLKTMRGVDTNFVPNQFGSIKYEENLQYGVNADGKKYVLSGVAKDSKKVKHQKQLTLYSYMLERTYDIKEDGLGIIPIEIDYDAPPTKPDPEDPKYKKPGNDYQKDLAEYEKAVENFAENSIITNADMKPLIPFTRLSSIRHIQEPVGKKERRKVTAPLDKSSVALLKYLNESLDQLRSRISEYEDLIKDTKDEALRKKYAIALNQVRSIYHETLNNKADFERQSAREFFDTLIKEITQLDAFLENGLMDPYIENKIFFLHLFITGHPYKNDPAPNSRGLVNINIAGLADYDAPEYNSILNRFNNVIRRYEGTGQGEHRKPGYIDMKAQEIIENDILVANNVKNNPVLVLGIELGMSEEDVKNLSADEITTLMNEHVPNFLEKIKQAPSDSGPGKFSNNLLGVGYTMGKDSIIPQVIKSVYQTAIETSQAKFKPFIDRLTVIEKKLEQVGITNIDILYAKNFGQVSNTLANAFDIEYTRWLTNEFNKVRSTTYMASKKAKKGAGATKDAKSKAELLFANEYYEAIDISLLPEFEGRFGDIYDAHVPKRSQADKESYANGLKELLGISYNSVVKEALDKFEQAMIFTEHTTHGMSSQDKARVVAENNPMNAIGIIHTPPIKRKIKGSNGVEKEIEIPPSTNFEYSPGKTTTPNITYVTLIPKRTNQINGKPLGYNHEFTEEINKHPHKDLLSEAWDALRESQEALAFTYRDFGISAGSTPRTTKTVTEKTGIKNLKTAWRGLKNGTAAKALLFSALQSASKIKETAYSSGKTDESTDKRMSSNYVDSYETFRKSLLSSIYPMSMEDLMSIVKDLNIPMNNNVSSEHLQGIYDESDPEAVMEFEKARKVVANNIAVHIANQTFSQDRFAPTRDALRAAVEQHAKQETLPKANILLETYKNLQVTKTGEKYARSLQDNNPEAVAKISEMIDRQFYGLGGAELDSNGNIKKAKSIRNEAKKTNRLQKQIQAQSRPPGKFDKMLKALVDGAVEHGFIKEKWIAFVNERESMVFQYLDRMLDASVSETSKVEFTLDGKTYTQDVTLPVAAKKATASEPGTPATPLGRTYHVKDEDGKVTALEGGQAEFERLFQEHLVQVMDNIGLAPTLTGIYQGIMSYLRWRYLAYAPISGMKNFLDGMTVNYIIDKAGIYWDNPKANRNSKSFLTGYNMWKIRNKLPTNNKWAVEEWEKLQYLLDNANILQSTAEGDERDAKGLTASGNLLSPFFLAVDLPEGKIQASILLNILQDHYIEDSEGNKVQVFDGSGFPAWDLVDGVLQLKPEFRVDSNGEPNESNLNNWERFEPNVEDLQDNDYTLMRRKVIEAIESVQGDYSKFNHIRLTKGTLGQFSSMMVKWFFMQHRQMWKEGGSVNITRGVIEEQGVARGLLKDNPAAFLLGSAALLGLNTGFSLATMGALGLGVGATFVLSNIFSNTKLGLDSDLSIKNNLKTIATLFYETLVELGDIPLYVLHTKKSLRDTRLNNKFSDMLYDDYDAQGSRRLRAMASLIATNFHWMAFPVWMTSIFGLYNPDDEPDEWRRLYYNFLQNLSHSMASNSSTSFNPVSGAYLASEMFALGTFEDYSNAMTKGGFGGTIGATAKAAIPEFMRLPFGAVQPLPDGGYNAIHTITGGIITDPREYNSRQWIDTWIKDMATEGEHSAEKNVSKMRNERKKDIKSANRSILELFESQSTIEARKAKAEEEIKNLPKKRRGTGTYKELEEEYKALDD